MNSDHYDGSLEERLPIDPGRELGGRFECTVDGPNFDEVNDDELVHLLHAAALNIGRRANDVLTEVLGELDLTRPLGTAIWQLDPEKPWPSSRQLANRLGCDPSTVTFLIDRLSERGLVQRSVGVEDRRVKVVSLTADGLSVRDLMAEKVKANPLFANLSTNDQRQLIHLIQAVIGEIDYSIDAAGYG